MFIGELAKQTGLSIDTIRFYEKEGLLDAEHLTRTDKNYRQYSEAAIDRLNLIKQAKLIGFTLTEIRSLIREWETDELSPLQKAALLRTKIEQINRHIASLEEIKGYLYSKMEMLSDLGNCELEFADLIDGINPVAALVVE